MSQRPKYWNRAKKILSKKDKVMRKLINNYKDKSLITRNDVFYSLCMSITGQQLSISSASAIFKRFQKKVGKITRYSNTNSKTIRFDVTDGFVSSNKVKEKSW